ncbi:MAG TPA: ATP-binding protein [Mycobacteriales bacterium]|nr:ATP-binding protein [Mycobacteriales bacterium]
MTGEDLIRRLALPGGRRDAGAARDFTSSVLRAGGVDRPGEHDAILVVSELVTNAALHGRAPVLLEVAVDELWVVIAVSDAGDSDPARQSPSWLSENGRGLRIVDHLAVDWRVEHGEGSKTVVVTLRR